MRFQNSATRFDVGFYAARSYSLRRPPRTVRRLVCFWERPATGWPGRGGRSRRLRWGRGRLWRASYSAGTSRRCGSPRISIRPVTCVRAVRTNRSASAFARGLRGGIFTASMPAPARTAPEDSVNCPARSRTRNRTSAARMTEVHQGIADLPGGPRPIRVGGHPWDVHVAAAGSDHEQPVQAPERLRAVRVKDTGGEHRRGLSAPDCRQVASVCRSGAAGVLSSLRIRRIVDPPARRPSLRSSPWVRRYPRPWFSVPSRSMSAVITALTGGPAQSSRGRERRGATPRPRAAEPAARRSWRRASGQARQASRIAG